MTELIPVSPRQIGDGAMQTVNARELHVFLEVGKDFATWIKNRIEQYGFAENVDFVTFDIFPQNGGKILRGRPITEYALSLDMAKELAMVERNAKGKQARQYFIECERRAKSTLVDINDHAQIRRVLLAFNDEVAALKDKVEADAPKVQFYEAVSEAVNCQSVMEVAKVLGLGQNRLYQLLRKEHLLMRNNLPYQQHVDAGHFRVIEKSFVDPTGASRTYSKTLVTGKGLALIQKRLKEAIELAAVAGQTIH